MMEFMLGMFVGMVAMSLLFALVWFFMLEPSERVNRTDAYCNGLEKGYADGLTDGTIQGHAGAQHVR